MKQYSKTFLITPVIFLLIYEFRHPLTNLEVLFRYLLFKICRRYITGSHSLACLFVIAIFITNVQFHSFVFFLPFMYHLLNSPTLTAFKALFRMRNTVFRFRACGNANRGSYENAPIRFTRSVCLSVLA
jgi:hypothetical protein